MKVYVVFRSITHATFVKKRLQDLPGLSMVHSPKAINLPTCSYAVYCLERHLDEVLQTADEMGIKVLGIFREKRNGEFDDISR